MVTEGIYLLGNAAHTLHPIAAQGLNLAIYEIGMFVEAMKNKSKNEIFSFSHLVEMDQQRQKQQRLLTHLSHSLSQLSSLPFSFLRGFGVSLGMMGLNLAAPVKNRVMNRILGKVGRTPSLLLSVEQ
jgi:2-octaprenyl-6-methoxyphenol hydroxylase